MNKVSAFKLHIIDDEANQSLWLVFRPQLMEKSNRPSRYLRATKCLVEEFFVIEQQNIFGENDEIEMENDESGDSEHADGDGDDDDGTSIDSDELPVKIIDELYLQLRETHKENKTLHKYPNEYIQHKDLRPQLTNYQIDGVNWMLNRERVINHFPTEFKEIKRRWPESESNVKFYYNERTLILMVNKNEDVSIPTGGILADAMGLGKTVEMLDLILLNPRQENPTNRQYADLNQYDFPDDDIDFLRCLCAKKSVNDTVRCRKCFMLQHRFCVSQFDRSNAPDAQYICPTCWQTEEPLMAKTTFIVSPPSIKLQWRDEVIKHISDENFKVSRLKDFLGCYLSNKNAIK